MKVPHNRLSLGKKEERAVAAVVRSGYIAGGVKVAALEKALDKHFGFKNGATAVASGSAALRLTLMALGIKERDEVLVPAYSCVALPNAVLSLGAKPIAVDVASGDLNIDAHAAAERKTARTKAAIAVNTFGVPANGAKLKALGLKVIEDGSHGFAYNYRRGRFSTSLADAAVISFYATKLIGGGEGGAVLSRNSEVAGWVRQWRDYTDQPADARRGNEKLSDLEAAIVLEQIKRLREFLKSRRGIALSYCKALAALPVILPSDGGNRVWYRYAISVGGGNLDKIISGMAARGVSVARPVESWLSRRELAKFPNAKRAYEEILSLPLYPSLTPGEQAHAIASLRKVLT